MSMNSLGPYYGGVSLRVNGFHRVRGEAALELSLWRLTVEFRCL